MPSTFAVDIQYWISATQFKSVAVMPNQQKSTNKKQTNKQKTTKRDGCVWGGGGEETIDSCSYLDSRNSVRIAVHAQPRVIEYLSTEHVNLIAFCMRIVFSDTGSQLGSGDFPSSSEDHS